MSYVDIASRFGDVTLRVTPVRHPWDGAATLPAWDIQVTGQDFDASAVVVEDVEAPQSLVEFCRELADDHKGWDGDKHWQSAGGGLRIRADHDQINTTRLHVSLSGGPTPPWTAHAELHVDPGRFDRVAQNLQLFGEQMLSGELDTDAEPERIDPRQRAREPRKKIGTPNIKQVGY
ncbi:MAG: DUF6228 family protein [Solirubrobacteraceae bacterium]